MSSEELKLFYGRVVRLTRPEDLFGKLKETEVYKRENELKKMFRKFLQACQPDKHRDDPVDWHMASECTRCIVELHSAAVARVLEGVYGTLKSASNKQGMVVKAPINTYRLFEEVVEGDLCDIYLGEYTREDGSTEEIIFKMVRESCDNDLMTNEKVLDILTHSHIPVMIEQFMATNGKMCTVLRKFEGYDFYQVRENPKYKDGVPETHLAWMLGRSLSGLGFAHSKSIVHAYLNPSHFMLRQDSQNPSILDHGLCILDWCYAAIDPLYTGARFKFFDEVYSAPEVAEKMSPVPSSDIFSLGKTMIFLSGGEPETNKFPDEIHPRFKAFMQSMVLESRLQRPRDAWQLHHELEVLRTDLWGKERYLEFRW